eukprot:TRINITY_DN2356_c0_g3_i1.p1 TRINITY_DN2356_c0_g3~~TRINITY_DN2356_c0_g3_i1.p1  ORF type:complete len:325 (-),score=30.53 TRINITY_DN2356_c0_g3_i1:525-1499(-)
MAPMTKAVRILYFVNLFKNGFQQNEIDLDEQGQDVEFQTGFQAAQQELTRNLQQLQQAQFQHVSEVLLAVVTANIFVRTHTFFLSLAAIDDDFDVLVVDEQSTDETLDYIKTRNISFIQSEGLLGVTHNWNLAYKYFIEHPQYNYLFVSNNDVLIPNTAIDTQVQSLKNCDCDLISPLSSMKGKGHMGRQQSIEVVYKLQKFSPLFHLDTNYQIVQNYLNKFKEQVNPVAQQCFFNKVVPRFNGFFFGFKKSSFRKIEINQSTLFDPDNRNIGQEHYLEKKMKEDQQKICLDRSVFVYHYKASTISIDLSDLVQREMFVRPSKR